VRQSRELRGHPVIRNLCFRSVALLLSLRWDGNMPRLARLRSRGLRLGMAPGIERREIFPDGEDGEEFARRLSSSGPADRWC
jgi:hypothetical protein